MSKQERHICAFILIKMYINRPNSNRGKLRGNRMRKMKIIFFTICTM